MASLPFSAIAQDGNEEGLSPLDQKESVEEAPPEFPASMPEIKTEETEEEPTGLDDEGLFEDVLPPASRKGEEGEPPIPRKVTIDAVVVVNYTFANPRDVYSVKYHINMGGETHADVGMIKGNAKIATDIGGFLAKSAAFECLLKVSIADVPYEMLFKKVNDSEADINVSFKGQILEDWESLCTFLDTSNAKFNTRGSPERWIGSALEKAKPPLSRLTAPLDPERETTLKFSIPKYTIQDEGLGTAEIDGTGVVTIAPQRPAEKPEGVPESRLPTRRRPIALSKTHFTTSVHGELVEP